MRARYMHTMYTYACNCKRGCVRFHACLRKHVHARHVHARLWAPQDVDSQVRKNSATCIREIAKHTPQLARLIVNAGASARPARGVLTEYPARLPSARPK